MFIKYISGVKGGVNMKNIKISVKFYFQSYTDEGNKNKLNIRVSEGRDYRKYIVTPFKLDKSLWNAKNEIVSNEHVEYETVNEGLLTYKKKRDEAIAKYQSGKFTADMVFDFMSGKQDATTLENYIESYYKENFNEISYTNHKDRLRYFKQILGRSKDLMFSDVDNNLIKKYRKIVDKRIKDGDGSATTYKSYLQAVLGVCREAFENKHTYEDISIAKRLKTFKNIDFGENPASSSDEVKQAIDNITTIQRWESVGQWLLMFGMRGLYPADIVKIAEKQLFRNANNGKRMPFVKVTKNIRADWSNGNLWLDYKRSKSGMPMFIKLLPSVIQLIEKLKYSYMFTHADKKIDDKYIVTDINNRLNILNYNIEDNYNHHKNLWRNRQKLLPLFSKLGTFKTPRKTFYQIADDEKDELTAKKLVGQTTDKLSKDFYSKYNTEKQVKKIDKMHKKVLREFKFDQLVNLLIKKFHELVEDDKAPKWLLKQSAVIQEGKEWRVLVGFKDRKPLFEKIPHKYKRFLDDNSIKEGYWVDLVDMGNEHKFVLQRVFKSMAKFRAKEAELLETNITKEALELKLEKLISEVKYMECEAVKKQLQELS